MKQDRICTDVYYEPHAFHELGHWYDGKWYSDKKKFTESSSLVTGKHYIRGYWYNNNDGVEGHLFLGYWYLNEWGLIKKQSNDTGQLWQAGHWFEKKWYYAIWGVHVSKIYGEESSLENKNEEPILRETENKTMDETENKIMNETVEQKMEKVLKLHSALYEVNSETVSIGIISYKKGNLRLYKARVRSDGIESSSLGIGGVEAIPEALDILISKLISLIEQKKVDLSLRINELSQVIVPF